VDDLAKEVTIFLVDDDEIDAMTVERGFLKQRISNPVVRASDGLEALEMLRSGSIKPPFIILLDLQMPRMGGLEFIREIRQDPELKSCVIFVLTTSRHDEDVLASYSLNIAGYILKENTGEEFLDIINMLQGYWKVVLLPSG
jgi:CheY-like chemotaxis protein